MPKLHLYFVDLVSEWSKAPLVGNIRLKLMMPRGSAWVQSHIPPDMEILRMATSDITTSLINELMMNKGPYSWLLRLLV